MALRSENVRAVRPASFSEQVKQVVTTYTTQRMLRWMAGLFCLFFLPLLLTAALTDNTGGDDSTAFAFLIAMPMMWSVIFLVAQSKSQFAHARARMMPNFLPPHMAVLATILLTMFVGFPAIIAACGGGSLLSLIALGMSIGAPAIWGGHLNRMGPTLLSLAAFYTLMTRWGQQFWLSAAANYWHVHAGIVLIGTALIGAWLWRLCHLSEEMDDYQNVFQAMLARRTSTEAVEQRRVVAVQMRRAWLMGRLSDWWYRQIGGYYGGGRAGLQRLLRYGFNAVPIEIQGLFFAAMALCLAVFFMQFSFFRESGASFGVVIFGAQFGILMPGQLAGEFLAQRRPRMAYEMLLPASRMQLVDALLAVSIQNAAKLWLIMHVTLGIALVITERPVSLRSAVIFLLLSAAVTWAAAGVSLRLATWASMAKRMLVSMLAWVVFLPPLIVWATKGVELDVWPFIVITAALLVIGLWAVRSARRAWLNLEFV
jgi:hypothetical protein